MNNNFIRVIPKLDIKNGYLIKGINLEGLRVLGDPIDFANYYYKDLADEICYIDNVATLYGTNNLSKFIKKTSSNIFIPLTVGGGVRTLNDIERVLQTGADKVAINSSVLDNINFLKEASRVFGSSTISINMEVTNIKKKYYLTKSNGRDLVEKNPLKWCRELEDAGAGEIILTSVNHEGLQAGFDLEIIKRISNLLTIPVIAHGGAGNMNHILDVIKKTNISGVMIASYFHYKVINNFKKKKPKIGNTFFLDNLILKKSIESLNPIKKLKNFLKKNKINVRL